MRILASLVSAGSISMNCVSSSIHTKPVALESNVIDVSAPYALHGLCITIHGIRYDIIIIEVMIFLTFFSESVLINIFPPIYQTN